MDALSDVKTFESIRQGDEVAYSNLFDQYYTALCYFADKYLNDMDWDKKTQLSIDSSLKSYLYFSVKNRAIDHLRKRKKTVPLTEHLFDEQQVSFDDLIEKAELADSINNCINQLPKKCREVFLLSRSQGLKYSEIAEKLDISPKTVEMQVSIALKRLRKSIFIFFILLFSL